MRERESLGTGVLEHVLFRVVCDIEQGAQTCGRARGHHARMQTGAQARRQACTQARTSDFRENHNIRFIIAKTYIVCRDARIVNISRVIRRENKR